MAFHQAKEGQVNLPPIKYSQKRTIMNINASIIDQQITHIVASDAAWLPRGSDVNKKKSAAFAVLCMAHCLDMPLDEAAEWLTDGGNDAGVDGLHIGDVDDGEFSISLFQSKYKVKSLDGTAHFPENGLEKAINTVQVLFDPYRHVELNDLIKPKIEEIRSLIRDGHIPRVRVVLCNNGAPWAAQADAHVQQAALNYGDKLTCIHFNHDSIVHIQQRSKQVDAALTLNGKALVEDMNYMRVLVGRVSVQEVSRLFNEHGDRLLERNIRRYLGLHSNRVNSAIHQTLIEPSKSDKFYFYNNGITVVCDKFDYNAFQQSDYQVQLKNMQIINGGQTCKTIQQTLADNPSIAPMAYVMIRVYQLAESESDFVHDMTYATNSQNPVDLRDLRSNDAWQKQLELGMRDLGYPYKRQRDATGSGSSVITSTVLAEAVLAIWRQRPHQAKYRRKEHFGKLYADIFKDLNAAQAVLAVTIFRMVETERKRPTSTTQPMFFPYASHYIAMLIGRQLLADQRIEPSHVSHRNVEQLLEAFDAQSQGYHAQAMAQLKEALRQCYGDRAVSLQQLAATFRRGDLLEMLAV
ncbi:MAG: AIPR family protein [Mariprofundaceae bacterium]|nr:AIPR family protein [Mariprofundaceae bacterium]